MKSVVWRSRRDEVGPAIPHGEVMSMLLRRPRPSVWVLPVLLALPEIGGLVFGQSPRPASTSAPSRPASTRPSAVRSTTTRPAVEFAGVVRTHFEFWDADGNQTLSGEEVESLIADPQITGEEAAALATLKMALRSRKFHVPPLTREYLARTEVVSPPVAPPEVDDDDDWTGPSTSAASLPEPPWQRSFAAGLRRIRATDRRLFADDAPRLDTCRQGPLGDCYFVAVVGALVARDPRDVVRMIQADGEQGFAVHFVGEAPVRIRALTEAQLAMGSTSGRGGLWLPVLEHAFAARRNVLLPEDQQHDEPTDIISHGGTARSTIRMLTGHETQRMTLGGGATTQAATAPTEERLARLREALRAGVADRRLMAAGTPKSVTTPGLSPNHAYAVLGYDGEKDEIWLWNPHGNRFKPDGSPGREHGYLTRAGQFRMPLADFAAVFRGVVFETDKPVKPSPRAIPTLPTQPSPAGAAPPS